MNGMTFYNLSATVETPCGVGTKLSNVTMMENWTNATELKEYAQRQYAGKDFIAGYDYGFFKKQVKEIVITGRTCDENDNWNPSYREVIEL